MEAIATYEAVWFEGRYRFVLLPDAIQVSGAHFLQADAELTVPLAGLQPRVDRLRVRNRSFWAGLWMALAGYFGCAVLLSGLKLSPLGFATVLFGVLGLAGVLLALATFRKVEFAQLVTEAGVPALAIARSRSNSEEYDRFVKTVPEQIQKCKG